jgi:hypothetical protein
MKDGVVGEEQLQEASEYQGPYSCVQERPPALKVELGLDSERCECEKDSSCNTKCLNDDSDGVEGDYRTLSRERSKEKKAASIWFIPMIPTLYAIRMVKTARRRRLMGYFLLTQSKTNMTMTVKIHDTKTIQALNQKE